MSETVTELVINLPVGGFQKSRAQQAVLDSQLPEYLTQLAPTPFAQRPLCAQLLEDLSQSIDLGLYARHQLEGLVRSTLALAPAPFVSAELTSAHRSLLTAFQVVTTCDELARRTEQNCPAPEVHGALELDGLESLLAEDDGPTVSDRIARIILAFVKARSPATSELDDQAKVAGTTMGAGATLLKNAMLIFAGGGELRSLVQTMSESRITIMGFPYDGLTARSVAQSKAGLLPIVPEQIVGNVDYLKAGLRLARDVAGFDFTTGKNPKKLNPILFGLGSPGCGKTVTAHAIGNYFLEYCRQRDIAGKFLVVRRSDWASSYQNASAANLIRLFREEVYAFDGVCGVYWPDIDTALASRSSQGLRTEEKQNLGAVFGVFDGTLLPKDGKWFMICDANTMHMDEAAVSRIAQNPFTVAGPTSPEDYVRLMRDLMLSDLHDAIDITEAQWQSIGALAVKSSLSGRNIEAICGNIRTHVQDFEFPDEYFSASGEERLAMLKQLNRRADPKLVTSAIERFIEFRLESDRRDEAEQFEREVEAVVRQLNAGRAAAEKAMHSL